MTDMTKKTYHFISGLPRSGSTLLSSILKQNPRFTAGITDPMQSYTDAIIRATETLEGGRKLVETEKRKKIIRGIFDTYYEDGPEVCFNTGRTWTAKTSILKELYPNFKMIVCVRSIPWVLNSFEKLHRKEPFTTKPIYGNQIINTVDDRCFSLFNPNDGSGVVGDPLKMMRGGVYSQESNHMIFVEYNALTKNPESTMRRVYSFLEEKYFDHDFEDVEDSYEEYDLDLKMSGLHTVKKKVEYIEGARLLPPQVWNIYVQHNFWEDRNFDKSQFNWISDSPNN